MRKEPLKALKPEDIKIEFVDVCVMPAQRSIPNDAFNIFEFNEDTDSDNGSPSTPVSTGISCSSTTSPPTPDSGFAHKPRKRAKLDHMSPEEKTQHRKMMNRISAQSARDRQKALMVRQDSAIKVLQAEIASLKSENEELTHRNEDLVKENETLREENDQLLSKVVETEGQLNSKRNEDHACAPGLKDALQGMSLKSENDVSICCGSPSEPAVLRTIPLQKGFSAPLQKLTLILVLLMSSLGILTLSQKLDQQGPEPWQKWCLLRTNINERKLTDAVAETITAQMADPSRTTAGVASLEASLVFHNYTKRSSKLSLQQAENIYNLNSHNSSSSNSNTTSKLASMLASTPLSLKTSDILAPSQLSTILSLPVKEPTTLKFQKVDLEPGPLCNDSSEGGIYLVPVATSGLLPSYKHFDTPSIFKQPGTTFPQDEDNPANNRDFDETDLYDSWSSSGSSLDEELFPELF